MPCDNTHRVVKNRHQMLPVDRVNTSCFCSLNKVTENQSLYSPLFCCSGRSSAGTAPLLHQIKHFQFSINFWPCWLHRGARWYSQPHLHPTQNSSPWVDVGRKQRSSSPTSLKWLELIIWLTLGGTSKLCWHFWDSAVASCSQSSLVWFGATSLWCTKVCEPSVMAMSKNQDTWQVTLPSLVPPQNIFDGIGKHILKKE